MGDENYEKILREGMIDAGLMPRVQGGSLVPKGDAAKSSAAAGATLMSEADWSKLSPAGRLSASMKAGRR